MHRGVRVLLVTGGACGLARNIEEVFIMMKYVCGIAAFSVPVFCVVALAGCSSTAEKKPVPLRPASPSPGRAATEFPAITLDTRGGASFGQAIRQIGEAGGGGAVLLSGLEDWSAPLLELGGIEFVRGLEQIVAERDFELQVLPDYVFIYPTGYEQLASVSLEGTLDRRYSDVRASFAVGAGTDLYNALALLSYSLGVTLVADNIVADAWCGELFLTDAPLPAILEALLKSARIPASTFRIESTGDYVFIRSLQNANTDSACLNADELSDIARRELAKRVRVRLPREVVGAVFESGATPLSSVLPALSAQTGLRFSADPAVAEVLVNPAWLIDIPLQTALDLIVWQWPVSGIGYVASDGAIHFRAR